MYACIYYRLLARSFRRVEDAEHTIVVGVGACAEDHRRGPAEGGITYHEPPQARDRDRVAGGVIERAEELPGGRVEGVDPAIPEVPHEQVASERAEALRGDCQSPRLVQRAGWPVGDEVVEQFAVDAVDVDDAAASARHHVGLGRVPLPVGDVDLVAQVLDAERRVAGR